jgi:thiamine pyrophosphate-dependent acetolactate synthase large subunit-like protein
MKATECFERLAQLWDDQVAICSLGTTSQEWWRITGSDRAFYMNSSMGLAASFGLGLSLAAPDVRVWTLDSDGALAMNLGALLTEGQHQPPNLVHFVLANDCYQVIGGHPLVGGDRMDWAGLAAASGIRRTFAYDSVAALEESVEEDVLSHDEHAFVVLRVDEEGTHALEIPFEGPEVKYRFGRYMEQRTGRPVFGRYGY